MNNTSVITLPMLASIAGSSRSYITRVAHKLNIKPIESIDKKHLLLSITMCHKIMGELGKLHESTATAPYIMSFINCFPNTYKTAMLVNYAHYLRIRGFKVLCVDFDNKASASEYYIGDECLSQLNKKKSAAQLLDNEEVDVSSLIMKKKKFGIDLIPSCYELFNSELDYAKKLFLDSKKQYWNIVKGKLSALTQYDVVLIDTASVFNYLTVSAIQESSSVIIPGRFNVSSAKKIVKQLGLIKKFYADEPAASGNYTVNICLTDEKAHEIADEDQMKVFVQKHSSYLMHERMPYSELMKKAHQNQRTVFEEELATHTHEIKKLRNNMLKVFREMDLYIDKETEYRKLKEELKRNRLMSGKAPF